MVTTTNSVTMATTSVTKDPASLSSVTLAATVFPSVVTPVVTSAIYSTVTKNPTGTPAIYATVTPRTPNVTTPVSSSVTPKTTNMSSVTSNSMTSFSVVTDNQIQVEAVIHRDPNRPASTYDQQLTMTSVGSRSRPESCASILDPTYATIADLDLPPKSEIGKKGQMMLCIPLFVLFGLTNLTTNKQKFYGNINLFHNSHIEMNLVGIRLWLTHSLRNNFYHVSVTRLDISDYRKLLKEGLLYLLSPSKVVIQ